MKRLGCLLLLALGVLAWPHIGRAESIYSLVSRGNQAFAAGKIDEALADYQRAAELDPTRPEVQINLGNALFKKGNPADALKAYTNALAADDPALRARALYNRGAAQIGLEDYAGAVQSLRQSLRLDPNDEDAKHNLLYAMQKKQEQEEQKKQDQEKKEQEQENQDQDQQEQDNSEQDREKQEDREEQSDQKDQTPEPNEQDGQRQESTPEPQPEQQQQQADEQQAQQDEAEQASAGEQEEPESPEMIDPAVAAAILDALQKEEQQQLRQRLQTENADEDEDKDW